MKKATFLLLFNLLLVLTGCQVLNAGIGDGDAAGRIVLWHSWTGEDEQVLLAVLTEFKEVYPQIIVVDLQIPEDEIFEQFKQKGGQAIGPDLIIGDASWIPELADAGIIEPYGEKGNVAMSELAEKVVTFDDQIYGLPFFVRPFALYYNKSLVEQPAATLDDVLVDAADGKMAAMIPRFGEAYWGIEAFGDDLFDDEGNLDLANSGLLPWLRWLGAAQNQPGLIMNVDDQRLEELFVSGDLAYYVAQPEKIGRLQEALGEDLGVSELPAGPDGEAGPLLDLEVLLFFSYSSPEQAELVRILGQFLSNSQQSIQFMRELNKVPANPRVAVDARLYPAVAGFSRQANSATTMAGEWDAETIVSAGDRAYAAVLSGELSAEEAICNFARTIAAEEQVTDQVVIPPEDCVLSDEEEGG